MLRFSEVLENIVNFGFIFQQDLAGLGVSPELSKELDQPN